jgi:hypothetical protein
LQMASISVLVKNLARHAKTLSFVLTDAAAELDVRP